MEFLKIHDLYYSRINRFIISLVQDPWAADDLVQEVFIKIDRHMDSLREKEKLLSWIYKIAYNLSMDYLRSRNTRIYQQSSGLTNQASGIQIEKIIEQDQMGRCVRDKVALLPVNHRIPLILYEFEGFSHKEMAQILGTTRQNTKTRLHRARKALKKILEKECLFEKDDRDIFVCVPKNDG